MVDQGLIDYVKSHLAQGFSVEEIRQSLLGQHLNSQEVEEAINTVKSYQYGGPAKPVPGIDDVKIEKKGIPHSVKIILAVIFVFLVLGILFLYLAFNAKPAKQIISVSEYNIERGVLLNELSEDSVVNFTLEGEIYTVNIESLKSDHAILGGDVVKTMNIGDEALFDLNGDSENDVKILLENITNYRASFYFAKYFPPGGCIENWICYNWSDCVNDSVRRLCIDESDCGSEQNKPQTEANCSSWTVGYSPDNETTSTDYYDCENDLDCFKNYSFNCSLAKVRDNPGQVEFMGILFSQNSLYRIEGNSNNSCVLYTQPLSISVEFSENYTNYLMNESNMTLEEVQQAEQQANESAQDSLIYWNKCYYSIDDLPTFIEYMINNPGDSSCEIDAELGEPSYTQICNFNGINVSVSCISGEVS